MADRVDLTRFYSSGIFLDTNLLVLLVVGRTNRSFIGSEKVTSSFTPAEYDDLVRLLRPFHRRFSLPHVFTETSNLLGKSSGQRRQAYFRTFARLIGEFEELTVESREPAEHPHFDRFGLVDLAILVAARDRLLIVTDDFRFADYAARRGAQVMPWRDRRLATEP